jgi:hypothetical protein
MISMPERMTLHKLCCCVCFIIIFLTSCNGRTLELVKNGNAGVVTKTEDNETLYYLDIDKPSIVQPLEPENMERGGVYKFVQVEVTKVVNPKKYPLTFQVHYQLNSKVKTYLGSFSLYPSDNPGKFIVATQGKLKNEGAIILSLVIPDNVDAGDTIKVAIKKIRFIKG